MRIKLLVLTLFTLFVGVGSVFAVSIQISNTPSSITDQPFTIDVTVSGAQAGTNYLRANLFPSGTTKYFGYTNNGTAFINSSDYSQYFPITIDQSGNWSGQIQAKLDSDSSYFSGANTYSLKVRRYTKSGSYTWSNEVTLAVIFATPTPAPTPNPTPSPTPIPTATPIPNPIPTTASISNPKPKTSSSVPKTPSSTSGPITPLPSSDTIVTPFPTNSLVKTSYRIASVAAAIASATPSAKVEIKNQKQINPFLLIGSLLVFAGVGFLGYIYLKMR